MNCKKSKNKNKASRKNLSIQEYQGFKGLRHNTDIIIIPADKGTALVIMDRAS